MKYMGSKLWMLRNGLGHLLAAKGREASRFVDLFAGSGAVASFVARRFSIPVLAFDLQQYSAILTGAVIQRRTAISSKDMWSKWRSRAALHAGKRNIPSIAKITHQTVRDARKWCGKQSDLPITLAYGGHYFSPKQVVWIDSLLKTLPTSEHERTVALASLIRAASRCAAAPGHTAQPFQLKRSSKPFIRDAWSKDIPNTTKAILVSLSKSFAKKEGSAEVADANEAAKHVKKGDLVFIDPPYSGVHYSRFYHVLESIARGDVGAVSGRGRYPDRELRPWSKYSVKRESSKALEELLSTIAAKGAKAIMTFPSRPCSNGLSGKTVRRLTSKYFDVEEKSVRSKFSTLGGADSKKGNGRKARQSRKELILTLVPRKTSVNPQTTR